MYPAKTNPCEVAQQLISAAANVQKAATCLSQASLSINGLQIDGKVPAEALRACSDLQSGHEAVTQHIAALQQCLLPCSAQIVKCVVSYLQLVSAHEGTFLALVQSGQLSQQCQHLADALTCAQEGYEALASDLLALEKQMKNTERKVSLNLQAAHEHLNNKLALRRVAQEIGPAAAATAAGLAAAAGALMFFPPLALVAAPLAGAWAGVEAGDSADEALERAQQQLARTEDISRCCDVTSKQLRHAMDLVAATSCVAHLAGYLSNLAASTNRASGTAGRLEARTADANRAAPQALCKVLLNQIREVSTAGRSFTAAVKQLTRQYKNGSTTWLELKPAYKAVVRVAQQLEAQMATAATAGPNCTWWCTVLCCVGGALYAVYSHM